MESQQRNVYAWVWPEADGEDDLLERPIVHQRRRPYWIRVSLASALGLALVGAAVWTAGGRWPLAARLRGSTGMEEEKVKDVRARSFCGKVEHDVELHTTSPLVALSGIPSQEMCCAHCNGNPKCGAWTWGKHEGVDGLTHHCFLKKLDAGEEPLRIKRFGVVSGFPSNSTRKHGYVAELLDGAPSGGREFAAGGAPSPSSGREKTSGNATCMGQLNVTGHGVLSVVAARWRAPDERGAGMAPPRENWQLEPLLGGRAYMAESCTEGQYQRGDYASLRLLGKTLRYTVDLSGAGCGCDARLSLVPMRHSSARSKCGDFYCSARSDDCGASCAEVALQDANQYAWSSSLHTHDDASGVSVGYGGGEFATGRREWNDGQYGPGAECIDTSWPFHVEVRFPTTGDGDLEAMEVKLTQDGHSCPLRARLDRYGDDEGRKGLAAMSRMLAEGVTPVVQYAGSSDLAWLDGLGLDGQGPCVKETPKACPASVRFYAFTVEDGAVPSLPSSPSRAPMDSPLEVAFTAVHSSVETEALRIRHEKVENATALREVGLGGDRDCGDDCSSVGIGVSLPGLGDKKESGFLEEADGQAEWEVLALVHARNVSASTGKIVAEKVPGEVLVGKRVGDWLDLAHEHGFVPIWDGGKPLLSERKVTYEKLVIGSCADMALHPIQSMSVCKDAAFALGYFDTVVTAYHGDMERPEGCYLLNGQVFLATNPANRGKGAAEGRMPICASHGYPTTITVTTTTTTTTATTLTTTTMTTTTTWGWPSLFCIEVMQTTNYEFSLVKEQIRRGAGIFNCDEYAVFTQTPGRINLGTPPHGPPVHTNFFEKAVVGVSQDGTAGNTLLFMHLWEAVKKDLRWKKHEWTIKADPDAVVLPWRIRNHLRKATGPNNYLVNCNKVPGNPNFPMIFGAFEAFSKPAMTTYYSGGDLRCKNELPWQRWGEDFFMHHCMKHLGVAEFDDFGILSDKRCMGANCGDGWAGAYHDFKDQFSWFQCWNQAVR